jgi:acetyl-CoA C-acetyltransferase
MREAVIVDAVRSPIGRAFKGSLAEMRPDDLGGQVVDALLDRHPEVDAASVEDLICGCGRPFGEQAWNLARMVVMCSRLPVSVPGTTVHRYCASGLQAIRVAAHAIAAGEGDLFIAAGVECVTRIDPYTERRHPETRNPRLFDEDGLRNAYIEMGETAERVAERYGVSREEMDRFAKRSQDRAVAARDEGFFDREIVPIALGDGDGRFERDDGPRPDTTLEKLASLQPVFRDDGRVTAGNSCPLNDGAAAVLVTSRERADELGLKPRARVVASAVSAIEPELMGVGPIPAIRAVLERAGMEIGDVDVVELNEAFAAQVLPVCEETGIDLDGQLNPHGGAIALGHPFGMTGARIMATLLNDLETLDGQVGLETMCVAGGQGMAMIVERLR